MPTFNDYDPNLPGHLMKKIKEYGTAGTHYETVVQQYTEVLQQTFTDSLILTRVFVTQPYSQLPASVKNFVDGLAHSKGVTDQINAQTPVLTLVGTRGRQAAWNNRRQSQGHVGIPLCSANFIEAIPMIARLLTEMGLGLNWIDQQDTRIIEKGLSGSVGMFYVAEAGEDVDAQGRKIIAAQDFVKAQRVRTVFGIGVAYIGGVLAVNINFTADRVSKEQLKPFLPLMSALKANSSRLLHQGILKD